MTIKTNEIEKLLARKEEVYNRIYFKIVNPSTCNLPLAEIPYQYVNGNLLKVFYVLVEMDSSMMGSVLITNPIMDFLNLDINRLLILTDRNTPQIFKPRIYEINNMLENMLGTFDELAPLCDLIKNKMFVLTNTLKSSGAGTMFYNHLLSHIADEMNCSFYILPSSIHEVILLKDNGDFSPSYLKELVHTANATMVIDEEVLSEHIFYFSHASKTLSVVA